MFGFKKIAIGNLLVSVLWVLVGLAGNALAAPSGLFLSASPYTGSGKLDDSKAVNYFGGFAASASYWVVSRPSFAVGPVAAAETTFFGAGSNRNDQGRSTNSNLSAQFGSVGLSLQYRNLLGMAHVGLTGLIGRGVGQSQIVVDGSKPSDFTEYSMSRVPLTSQKIIAGADFDLGENVVLSLGLFRTLLKFDVRNRSGQVTESQTADDGNVYSLTGNFDAKTKADYFPDQQTAKLYGLSIGVGVNI